MALPVIKHCYKVEFQGKTAKAKLMVKNGKPNWSVKLMQEMTKLGFVFKRIDSKTDELVFEKKPETKEADE